MKISLIGMSGVGKSHWANLCKNEKNFKLFCIDDLIEKKLKPELQKLKYQGINDVSKWMGQPYHKRYIDNSEKYLYFEIETMKEVLDILEKASKVDNVVIDTTGSVIYTSEDILERLKKLTTIVYLEIPEQVKDKMLQLYLDDPKPVFWGDIFSKKPEESELEAVQRCYPSLLKDRIAKYGSLADITLDYSKLRSSDFKIKDFIGEIKS